MQQKPMIIALGPDSAVSGLWTLPSDAKACLVLAHGAGAGMRHAFMEMVAAGLAERSVATLRFNFPSMEAGSKRPDAPERAQAAIRSAVNTTSELASGLPLFAGGKSFGGRMTSNAQAAAPLAGVRGLIFFGFPLYPIKKPSTLRAIHLGGIEVPMLFLQGSRDALADPVLMVPQIAALGAKASLHIIDDADHSFHVPKRTGRTDADVMTSILDETAAWIGDVVAER